MMAKLWPKQATTGKPAPVKPIPTFLLPYRRGRMTPVDTPVIGEPVKDENDPPNIVGVTTQPLAGSNPQAVLARVIEDGFDPARALAEGYNVLSREKARGDNPGVEAMILESGLVADSADARIAGLHIRKLAQKLSTSPEALIDLIREQIPPAEE